MSLTEFVSLLLVDLATEVLCGNVSATAAPGVRKSVSNLLTLRWDSPRCYDHPRSWTSGTFRSRVGTSCRWKSDLLLPRHCIQSVWLMKL